MESESRAVRLVLWGASGRMGGEILRQVQAAPDMELVQAVVSAGSRALGQRLGTVACTAPGPIEPGADAIVDFSTPDALGQLLERASATGKPLVSGTTGLKPEQRAALEAAARHIAVFWAPNFSVGLAALVAGLRAVLPLLEGFELELVEHHHGAKKDAPSGTALKLLAEVERHRSQPPRLVHGRQGMAPRQPGDIGVHAVRGGSNPGRHEVHVLGQSEELLLAHQVWGREVFALGALRAVRFVLEAPAGLYGMDDLLASRRR